MISKLKGRSRRLTGAHELRVFYMIGTMGIGGAESQVVLRAKELRARGVDSRVLLLFDGGPFEAVLQDAGVPVVHLRFRTISTVGWWQALFCGIAAFCRLVRLLRQARPHVLHAHLFHSYAIGVPAGRLAGVPLVVAGRHTPLMIIGWGRLTSLVDKAANHLADHIIPVSQSIADELASRFHVRHKISVIRNGLPPVAFLPQSPASLETKSPVVVCVSRLHSLKGHCYLLDATALLERRGLRCTVVLIGDGPERGNLEKQAERLGIDVRFLGFRTDVGAWLARADIMAHPTLAEALGNCIMEAMAAGLPTVSTNVGGVPELLGENRGLLVPPADVTALADAIQRLLTDHVLAKQLSASARAWAVDNLTSEKLVNRYLSTYSRLMHQKFTTDLNIPIGHRTQG
ncbi:glycosyltransferase involved in cell wall biosynthesis [Streptosporangium album]|uniref:Glycosyltransferase involved in cell wall biosynthesis n=1 Tax=Streptosporangium album TaxID=47479 RepID=A0A7W7W786_9ACTN|nr:glycosyltransferase [Streptosporangium album]MBB4935774.1 glycosyltransferase involved in cell wall biosynthesis [Streptosporangium album]